MKFLIYNEDKKAMNYFKYLIEETFTCKVELSDSTEEFIQFANNSLGYDWMFFSSNEALTKEQKGILENAFSKTPSIFIRSLQDDSPKITPPSLYMQSLPATQKILQTIADSKGIPYDPEEVASGFIPVSMDYLARIFQTRCDFFIKLSNVKFLKIIKKGIEIQGEDLRRYCKDEYGQLFVRTHDFHDFLDSVEYTERDYTQMSKDEAKKEMLSDMEFAHHVFYHLSSKFGLNAKALQYANNAFENLHNFIEEDNNLHKVWQALIQRKNFITEHSLMVAFLANAVLSHTEYKNENNSIRLSLAALLHDVELRDEKFYPLELIDDESEFSVRELNTFRSHIHNGVELLEKFKNIPSDLDKILLMHHEKYDGSGFPRGLNGSQIPRLAAIFIVCHEFVIYMMKNDFTSEGIKSFLDEKKATYKEGAFRDTILILEQVRI